MAKPINVFKSDEEFQKCAKDWQHKLFLDNWFIEFELTTDKLYQETNLLWGYNSYSFENCSAAITVFNGEKLELDDGFGDSFSKNIAELTLVHELLHIKFEYVNDPDVIGDIAPIHQSLLHQATEAMAKSLIMTKYNLDYDYFKNNTIVRSKSSRKAV